MHWRRWTVILSIAAGIVAAIVYALRPQPVPIEMAEVVRGPLTVTVEEEGKTRVKERYVIYAPVTGYNRRLDFDAGDPVKQGQVVATIEPSRPVPLDMRSLAEGRAAVAVAGAQVQAAEQRIRAATANAEYWSAELKRVNDLVRTGDIARSRLEQTVSEQQRAAAALAEAQHAMEAAQSELRRARAAVTEFTGTPQATGIVEVRAPVAGRVLKLLRESAGAISVGEPLLEIGNARAIEVEIEVLSPDAVRIKPGTSVVFTRWGGDGSLEGVVQRIEPSGFTKISALGVEEQRVPVIAILTSPETVWSGLGAGYRVEASFILWQGQDVLQVPTSSLFRYGDGWAVFVVDGGSARRRLVELGHRSGLRTEITSGLQPGERVIAYPDETIEDGTPVEPRA
ncbi:MAG: efflux RND transporter periplasmic adaptor subunit [Bryobacterales bacterium]|nr:efflux RND transporter periplasmic adaptor subunit [Bryobacterales bacterium]MEB2359848.1 efflux RND transporter periplasmic adaptor subunit [Bryobacterales bacterium]